MFEQNENEKNEFNDYDSMTFNILNMMMKNKYLIKVFI